MEFSGAKIITRLLERQGVEIVAGIPGGANLPLYDALRESRIRHILARHEQGAGFIAQGMARVTGRAAVCLGTSGPGATNLLTAIADAKLDSIPLVAITGQVATSLIGTDAFQEVDMYGLTLPITKHNFLVRSPEELLEVIPLAFEMAESGRPGPVAIDIPKDVQIRTAKFDVWPEPWRPRKKTSSHSGSGGFADYGDATRRSLDKAARLICQADRPVLYIGGGVIASGAGETARAFAQRIHAPIVSTLMGLGAIPCDDPSFLGMLGMHGERSTNLALDEADLLIAAGARFDDRATGKVAEFCRHANIIHIDIDHSEIDKIKPTNVAIVADSGYALRALHGRLAHLEHCERPAWSRRVNELRATYPSQTAAQTAVDDHPLRPLNLIRALGDLLEPETVIATDVGQHQMWTAQAYPFRRPRTFLTSGGLGTMGFGLPAAIGAALAKPGERVVCISGDGSILMNIQELAVLAEEGLNVTLIVMNNNHLGLVRQQQELFYGERYHASEFQTRPDFAAIAEGFGVRAFDLGRSDDPIETLSRALTTPGPNVINAPIAAGEMVYPMVPPGAANSEMIGGEQKTAVA